MAKNAELEKVLGALYESYPNSSKAFTLRNKETGVEKYLHINMKNKIVLGGYVETTAMEIYRAYNPNVTDDEVFTLQNGYGLRTAAYFDKVKNEHGFLGWDVTDDSSEFGSSSEDKIQAGRKECRMYADGDKWTVYWADFCPPDDLTFQAMFFSRKPTVGDIEFMMAATDIEGDISLRRIPETFVCWECGREVHWLDIEGGLREKAEGARDRYCGC